jgi:hypothetical protein
MPYGILQGYSMAILLLMAALTPSRYSLGHYLYWVFGWYLLSKFFETFDAELMGLGHMLSGHTLKHLAAALAPATVCLMLSRRTLIAPGSSLPPAIKRAVSDSSGAQWRGSRARRPGPRQ